MFLGFSPFVRFLAGDALFSHLSRIERLDFSYGFLAFREVHVSFSFAD